MTEKLNWGIIGLGRIAHTFASTLKCSHTGLLCAVGSRAEETALAFGREFKLPDEKCYPTYESLLADKQVEAVYIATPHPMHLDWVLRAAEAGKHILCEKPIGINHRQAESMVKAARGHDVFLMEAFMYRCHPQTQKIVDLLDQGAIGEVRVIEAAFAFNAGFDPNGRLFANHLGGGGILDIGCYPISMARLVAGRALRRDFADPIDVQAVGHLCETGVDGWTVANLRFDGDILAQVATGIQVGMDNGVRIWGTEGHIIVPSPWIPARDGGKVEIQLNSKGKTKPITIRTSTPLYAFEADTVARDLNHRQARAPAMSWDDTLGNMRTLDRWREEIGFALDEEKGA